jgi:hypothetical protein
LDRVTPIVDIGPSSVSALAGFVTCTVVSPAPLPVAPRCGVIPLVVWVIPPVQTRPIHRQIVANKLLAGKKTQQMRDSLVRSNLYRRVAPRNQILNCQLAN